MVPRGRETRVHIAVAEILARWPTPRPRACRHLLLSTSNALASKDSAALKLLGLKTPLPPILAR